MEDIIIRPLTKKDVAGVAEIKVNGWKTAYKGIIDDGYLNKLNIEEYKKIFNNYVGDDNFVVAILNEKVVGFCRFTCDTSSLSNIDYIDCELTAIYVHPNFKGRGIGTKMFEYVVDKFSNQNKNSMILWCLTDNVKSIEFYKHMGGEVREVKIAQIGDKSYKEVGFVYNIKELCKKDKNKII